MKYILQQLQSIRTKWKDAKKELKADSENDFEQLLAHLHQDNNDPELRSLIDLDFDDTDGVAI